MIFKDCMRPECFDRLITSVKTLCNFEEAEKTKVECTSSLALKLWFSLKKCIAILKGKALLEKDDALFQDQACLDALMVSEWNGCISYRCLSALQLVILGMNSTTDIAMQCWNTDWHFVCSSFQLKIKFVLL